MTQDFGKIYPGKRVRTLFGEIDTDHHGDERRTLPGSWGHVSMHNHADHWDVTFPNGGYVVITESELLNTALYQLGDPSTLEQRALALQYGQDVCELTMLDDPLGEFTQEIAGNPHAILDLVAENRRLQDAAADMLDVIRQAWQRWDCADQDDNPALGDGLERIASQVHAWEATATGPSPSSQHLSAAASGAKANTQPHASHVS